MLNLGNQATTKILDVSWHMPNLAVPRDATAEFAAGPRIPRAIRWDLDEVATRKGEDGNELGLGHMMPSGERFREACGELSGSRLSVRRCGLGRLRTLDW